mmetsp:Transcript_54608/g.130298  ORF Transcript_54608/g.130298 Transcript_54608/m.130298 type:complete len:506 (-) Transcript_54608:70-1587(-)
MKRIEGCLTCEFLGHSIFGVDVDEVFQYQTPKVVKIYDRTLGITKIVLSLLIFLYIVVYQLFYRGQHFEASPVEGVYRLQWQHPVKDHCNPQEVDCLADYTPLSELPYCEQYGGRNASEVAHRCSYFDAFELPMQVNDGILLPTFIRTFKQQRMCQDGDIECSLKWQFVDANGDPQQGDGDGEPVAESYVADVEDFTMLIDHAFRLENGVMGYDDFHMKGNWMQCEGGHLAQNCTTRPTICAHSEGACGEANKKSEDNSESAFLSVKERGLSQRRLQKHSAHHHHHHEARAAAHRRQPHGAEHAVAALQQGDAPEPQTPWEALAVDDPHDVTPKVISIPTGDVLSVRTLLAMAGRSLDDIWYTEDGDPQSIRLRGTIIVVHIRYHNMVPWTIFYAQDPPEYTIEVVGRPVYKFKHSYVSSETSTERTLTVAYGIQIIVQQSGDVRVFNAVHGLVIVTAALGLLAMANTFTNMLAMYVLPRKDEYKSAMFEETEDFHGPPEKEAEK